MNFISIFLLGLGVLVGALFLNFLASLLGLMSWYDFLKEPSKAGFLSYLWLFFLYPLGLGIVANVIHKMVL